MVSSAAARGSKSPEPRHGELKEIPAPSSKMECSEPSRPGSSSGISARSSFSSVRERVNASEVGQTFTSSKVSSYSMHHEEAVITAPSPSPKDMATATQTASWTRHQILAEFSPPLTQPQSKLHGNWLPVVAADGFQGWKQIDIRGKQASRSYGDLQSLRIVWAPPPAPPTKITTRSGTATATPRQSVLESLPPEILGPIIGLLVIDVPPNGLTARNIDLMSLLLTSRTMHSATLNALYKHITIPHSRIYRKFLTHVQGNPELGTIVRRLDFSHFNPMVVFSTAAERATTRNLTPETLLQCLELTPYLKEFLAQEYIADELDDKVLTKLFFGLDRLQALDFTACTSAVFKAAVTSLLDRQWPDKLNLARLSFHKCLNLPPSFYHILLSRLTKLTHLDVAGTRITDDALWSIPRTARLTHLNLAKCSLLTAESVVCFLSQHPAVKGSLVYLSLAADARSHRLLDRDDLTRLLPLLPPSLRSLSLKGSNMSPSHIHLLRPLARHLEELALGRQLSVRDVDQILVPHEDRSYGGNADNADNADGDMDLQPDWMPHTIRYLDLSDYEPAELDLNMLFDKTISIMKRASAPLEVVEVADGLYPRLTRSKVVENEGWAVQEFGSRAWLVRRACPGDDVSRAHDRSWWKMGATFWGMRKIPVVVSDVGGMYGSYMFKRRL